MVPRQFIDRFANVFLRLLALVPVIAGACVIVGLTLKSVPILEKNGCFGLLFSSAWKPLKGAFGFWPFITGTLWVTLLATAIALPLSLLSALYLSEYAPHRIQTIAAPFIDLLAGIPSVVFGLWGVLAIVPFIKNHCAPQDSFSSGYSVLAAAIVLAIMIIPFIVNVSIEVLRSVPNSLREASLALGATQWQTIKHVVIRRSLPGLVAAMVLGLSRAFGETMAVLMVAGNVARTPRSVFDPAYPLPALIANNYGEMLSIPLYDSALMFAAFILLLVVLVFNIVSRGILVRIERAL